MLCCMRDRAVCVYDARAHQAAQKVYLQNRSNSVTWNPMRPMDFAVGNEDSNVYIFDSRRLDKHRGLLRGHVDAVLSVDFSPTGRELVSGGFDKYARGAAENCIVDFGVQFQRAWPATLKGKGQLALAKALALSPTLSRLLSPELAIEIHSVPYCGAPGNLSIGFLDCGFLPPSVDINHSFPLWNLPKHVIDIHFHVLVLHLRFMQQ